MARQLNPGPITDDAVAIIAVDDDDTTIVEFVDPAVNAGMVVDPNVTVQTGDTWKGTSFPTFSVYENGFNGFGIDFSTPIATPIGLHCCFLALNSIDSDGGGSDQWRAFWANTPGQLDGLRRALDGTVSFYRGTSPSNVTTQVHPLATKLSIGAYHETGTAQRMYYGLESGSSALVDEFLSTTQNVRENISTLGDAPGQGSLSYTAFCVAFFNRELTEAEFQTLHDSWDTTLFVGGPPSEVLDPVALDQAQLLDIPGILLPDVLSPQELLHGHTIDIPALSIPGTGITIGPFRNNTGQILANLTGLVADVLNPATGASVVRRTSLTTDGNGILNFDDAALQPGTTYIVVMSHATGQELGVERTVAG